jgi:outer membrane receptor for ferrienterochelin and colicins
MMTAVYAQEEGSDEKTVMLEQVVVTGTGTLHKLKDTPVPVDVITANDLKKAGIADFQQAMTALAPSLSFSNNARGSNLVMNGLTNKYVLILVNGKKLTGDTEYNVDLSRIDMNRVQRIEILKGAGSALYGSDAIAGVINIITAEPENLLTVTSNTKVEEYGQITQGANVDVTTAKFGSYTAYTYQQSDGWQLNHFDADGKEAWTPSSDHFKANVFNQRFTVAPVQALSFYAEGGYYDRTVERPPEGYSYNLGYGSYNVGAGSSYQPNDRSDIRLDVRYDKYDTRYDYFKESGNYKPGDVSVVKEQEYLNAHLKSLFRFTENTQTVFGAEYISESLLRPDAYTDESVATIAVYGQEEISFLKYFQAVVGVRYTGHANAGSNFAPKLSLMYRTAHFNMRAQYSAGFRAPGINELYYYSFSTRGGASSNVLTVGNSKLVAEKNHYGSLNLEYHNDRLSAGVTGYVNKLRDMINSRTTNMADMTAEEQQAVKDEARPVIGDDANKVRQVKKYANDDQAIVKGVEVSLNVLIGSGFSAGGNYVYADARTKDIATNLWRDIERSVRHAGNLNANYTKGWGKYRLNVNLNGRLQGKRTHLTTGTGDTPYNDESAPAYAMWNLNTRHTIDCFQKFTVEPGIGVNNIFDKTDRRPYGVNYFSLSPGRTFYASLLLRFKN